MVVTRELTVQTLRTLANKQHAWKEAFGGYSETVEKVLIYAADEIELLMLREGEEKKQEEV